MYHGKTNPPKASGRCDVCGGELVTRSDDRADVVRDRLRVYREQTRPLLEYYGSQSIVRTVDGTRSIPEVTASVLQALGRS
jgi:adenylate kinase